MKKYLITITSLLLPSTMGFAATVKIAPEPPMMVLTTIDFSGEVPKSLNSTTYSISNKKIQLCWEVINVPFTAQNKTTEIFNSPAKSTMMGGQGDNVVSTKDGKMHTITSQMKSVNNEFIRRCWKFDNTDPIGDYTLDLQINDTIFPTQKFKIVK
ncbi:pseudouridine synthase [Glaesserella parasuis]|uniref:Pseudouridine synthase n=3 Tax=Glaesserella parasuis TaxID=738 RepID=A0A6I4QTB7_GLAPU|nr:hypothetical protein [Glaesserella parasuis]EQA02509.1 hypothetical protein HPSMNH_0498 [Glaesserella parasuis MN-H]EQA13803.1 hypothetical protein HPSSW140_0734 [Glaesserella parasuis SW140]EQA14176.1 hypothetical protein HPS174_0648 [Glaesserella parasuis 174]AMW17431.1 pseudouridine synthase [Glaesserella parasuis]ATW43823.1 pseudouridine synthase [Glaesserella parasuis D74]